MRRRQITYRLSESEYQALGIVAAKRGLSPSAAARLAALESLDLSYRLAAIEQAIQALDRRVAGLPERAVMAEAFNRIAARLPKPATTGAQP